MKLVVISSPEAVADEPAIINGLFAAGLEILHLRKPGAPVAVVEKLLIRIHPAYHSCIALHQQHGLAKQFGIKRIHFPEQERQQLPASDWPELKEAGYKFTTSVHQPETLKHLPPVFDYVFLSPVFNSISKPGYQPLVAENFFLAADDKPLPVMALGGITPEQISRVREMNFDGAAVLGAIWQEPGKALENFKILQQVCSQAVLSY